MIPVERRTSWYWEAELDRNPCDRYNNAELTLVLRLFLEKIEPAGISGTFTDADGVRRNIVRWGKLWDTWPQQFKQKAEAFWSDHLCLKAPAPNQSSTQAEKYDFMDRSVTYRPNIKCRFKIELVSSPSAAHTTIKVVRLDPTETSFRSGCTTTATSSTLKRPVRCRWYATS